ncbi:thioredoxin family protein [Gottschalkiaceae bacterium SANA]|nr:thioredoxin family protein [Gottschalkiaceae bacterium SANA]
MKFLNEEIKKQLEEIFQPMKKEVTIALFATKEMCESCEDTKTFMAEMTDIHEKIKLEVYDLEADAALAETLQVKRVPAIVLLGEDRKDYGIQFYGLPGGHEINSFISGLLEVSGSGEQLPKVFADRVAKIEKPIDIKVFVTLGCPHCPGAVSKAHKLALENPNVRAEMIEAQTFSELSDQYNVSGVPKIVINGKEELVGDQPLEMFLDAIERV